MVFPSVRCLTCKNRHVKVTSSPGAIHCYEFKLTMHSAMHRDRSVTDAEKEIGIVSGRILMHRQPTFPSKAKTHLPGESLDALVNGLT